MSQSHPEPNYFQIIVTLAILTVAEVAVVFAPFPRFVVGFLLVGMALSKAMLVALYFMHLKFERSTLMLIAATPLILCTMLMFALLPDSNPEDNLASGETVEAAPAGH